MAPKELFNYSEMENIGWQKMNAILDKEMPQAKSNRPGIIWWWIGGAAAAAIITLFFILPKTDFSSTQTVVEDLVQDPDQVQAQVQDSRTNEVLAEQSERQDTSANSNSNSITIETNANLNSNSDSDLNSNPNPNSSVASARPPLQRSGRQSPLSQQEVQVQESSAASTPLSQQEVQDKVLTEQSKRQNASEVLTEQSERQNASEASTSNEIASLDRLPVIQVESIDMPLVRLDVFPENSVLIIDPPIQKQSAFRLGLEAFSNFGNQGDYGELGGGVFIDWKMYRRWNLSTGLHFSKRSRLAGLQQNATLELADLSNSNTTMTGSPVSSTDPGLVNFGQDLNISQWNIPIRLSYTFAPGWKSSIHSKLSFLNFAQENYARALLQSSPQSSIVPEVKKWNVHLGLGIVKDLSPRLSAGLYYNWLLDTPSIFDRQLETDEFTLAFQYSLN